MPDILTSTWSQLLVLGESESKAPARQRHLRPQAWPFPVTKELRVLQLPISYLGSEEDVAPFRVPWSVRELLHLSHYCVYRHTSTVSKLLFSARLNPTLPAPPLPDRLNIRYDPLTEEFRNRLLPTNIRLIITIAFNSGLYNLLRYPKSFEYGLMDAAKIIGTSACGFDKFLNSRPFGISVFHVDILFPFCFFFHR
jgi:hypothetical protein